jgi:hypothetical protein
LAHRAELEEDQIEAQEPVDTPLKVGEQETRLAGEQKMRGARLWLAAGQSFAFGPPVCCIEGLTRPMAERPCRREATETEYGNDD